MLEKLFGVGSFCCFIGHLVHHHAILLTSLGKLGLPFVVKIIALVLLKCWALIAFTCVTRF
jgi:hypothetical protein